MSCWFRDMIQAPAQPHPHQLYDSALRQHRELIKRMYFGAKLRVLPPWLSVKWLCVTNLKLLCACFLKERLKVIDLICWEGVRIKTDNLHAPNTLQSTQRWGSSEEMFVVFFFLPLLSLRQVPAVLLRLPSNFGAQTFHPGSWDYRPRLPSLTNNTPVCRSNLPWPSPPCLSSLTPHCQSVLSF